jgi:ribosomal protein L7/L12
MEGKRKKIIEEIMNLSGTELVKLYEELLSETGISADMLSFGGGASASTEKADDGDKAGSKFKLTITNFAPEKKTALIKILRDVLSIGLAESKNLVDGLEQGKEILVKGGMLEAEANELMTKIKTETDASLVLGKE